MSAEQLDNFIEVDIATFGSIESAAGDPIEGGPFLLQPNQFVTIYRRDGRRYRLTLRDITNANS